MLYPLASLFFNFSYTTSVLTLRSCWQLFTQSTVYKLFRGEGSEHDLALAGHAAGSRYGMRKRRYIIPTAPFCWSARVWKGCVKECV